VGSHIFIGLGYNKFKKSNFGIKDLVITIRIYNENNFFGILLNLKEYIILTKIGIDELEQKNLQYDFPGLENQRI